jgi:hypothetical protein
VRNVSILLLHHVPDETRAQGLWKDLLHAVGRSVGRAVTQFTVRRHKTDTWTPASNHDAHTSETHVIRNKLQQRRTPRGPQGVH